MRDVECLLPIGGIAAGDVLCDNIQAIAPWLQRNRLLEDIRTLGCLLGSSLFFWLWTNFGIWATGENGMYPRTIDGLVSCYVAAIPFLGNALVGDLAWGLVLFLSFHYVRKLAPRYGLAIQGA